jgi:ribosome biogenesis GTPase
MKAIVMKSTGSWYEVLADDTHVYTTRIRGKMRLEGKRETNPVAVGDFVELEASDRGDEMMIANVLPRENYIARKAIKKSGQSHVIAANIDQALLLVSLSFPRTSLGFIDRFTVSAEAFRIPQIIVFNKIDLLNDEGREYLNDLDKLYTSLGVVCLQTSALLDEQTALKEIIYNKKTLITGHSGAGKSTLLNKLSKNVHQKTAEVSEFSSKGTHTTTFAEMFMIDEKTFVIDTPGIKELGMVDMRPEEVSDYFVEMRDRRLDCKFAARCLHVNEPGCAVKEAVEKGKIAIPRYESYLSIISGEDNRK